MEKVSKNLWEELLKNMWKKLRKYVRENVGEFGPSDLAIRSSERGTYNLGLWNVSN